MACTEVHRACAVRVPRLVNSLLGCKTLPIYVWHACACTCTFALLPRQSRDHSPSSRLLATDASICIYECLQIGEFHVLEILDPVTILAQVPATEPMRISLIMPLLIRDVTPRRRDQGSRVRVILPNNPINKANAIAKLAKARVILPNNLINKANAVARLAKARLLKQLEKADLKRDRDRVQEILDGAKDSEERRSHAVQIWRGGGAAVAALLIKQATAAAATSTASSRSITIWR